MVFTDLEEVLREVSEHWVESVVMKMAMLVTSVMIVIDEVLDIVVRSDQFYVLKQNKRCNCMKLTKYSSTSL